MRRTVYLAWATLATNVVTILLGALVRATGSGAGCGRSWPACRGQLLPAFEGATAVEFTHRAASGVALVMVAILVWSVFRTVGRGHPARRGAVLSAVAIVIEALIGAVIVLFEWVAEDASLARAVSVPLHLVNTFFLLAALTLTAHWLQHGGDLEPHRSPTQTRSLLLGALGMVVVAASGAVTALADTLFPKESLLAATGSVSGVESLLTRLRIVHPLIATVMGVGVAWWANRIGGRLGGRVARIAKVVVLSVAATLVVGALNVLLLTPLFTQLLHLALADVLWIAWIWLGAELLASGRDSPKAMSDTAG